MIEEELYRRATEELNGPNRRADLWKRAVALATDDHDEARYLYTNLRVEELIEERELTGGTAQFSDHPDEQETESHGQPDQNNNEPNDDDATDGVIEFTTDAPPAVAPASINTPEPALSASTHKNEQLGIDQLNDELDLSKGFEESFNREPSRELIGDVSESMRAANMQNLAEMNPHELDPPDQDETNLGLDELLADDNQGANDLIGEDDPTIRVDTLDTNAAAMTGVMTESAQATGGHAAAGGAPGATDPIDDLDEFLEATAAMPTADRNDGIGSEDNPEIDLDERANQTLDITRHLDETSDNSLASLETLGTAAGVGATAKPILGHGRKRYNILAHFDGRVQAVKHGVSWPALFFTMPWLLIKKLWGTLLVYLILFAVIAIGGIALALHIDAASNWTNGMRLATVGFAVLGAAGVLLIPFVCGNNWVARRWQRKGFESHGIIKANSPEHALSQLGH